METGRFSPIEYMFLQAGVQVVRVMPRTVGNPEMLGVGTGLVSLDIATRFNMPREIRRSYYMDKAS